MRKQLLGMVMGLSLIGAGMARAEDDTSPTVPYEKQLPQERTPAKPMTGSDISQQATLQPGEIEGKLVRVDSKTLFVEHMGVVVPLKVDRNTKFEGAAIRRAGDFKEGQQVRASFKIENKVNNVATRVSLSEASRVQEQPSQPLNVPAPTYPTFPDERTRSPDEPRY